MDNDTQTFVTAAPNGDVLAVVRIFGDHYQKYTDGQWADPEETDRTAYDQDLHEIDPDKVDTAAKIVADLGTLDDAKDVLLNS